MISNLIEAIKAYALYISISILMVGCNPENKSLSGEWQGYSKSDGYFEMVQAVQSYTFGENVGFIVSSDTLFIRKEKVYRGKKNSVEAKEIGKVESFNSAQLIYILTNGEKVTLIKAQEKLDIGNYTPYNDGYRKKFDERRQSFYKNHLDSILKENPPIILDANDM